MPRLFSSSNPSSKLADRQTSRRAGWQSGGEGAICGRHITLAHIVLTTSMPFTVIHHPTFQWHCLVTYCPLYSSLQQHTQLAMWSSACNFIETSTLPTPSGQTHDRYCIQLIFFRIRTVPLTKLDLRLSMIQHQEPLYDKAPVWSRSDSVTMQHL